MKKIVSILLLAATMLATCACNKQDQPQSISKMSDMAFLINGLVSTDENGNITGYNVGDCLNEANPWEISVPVNNFEEALSIFKSIIPADAVLIEDGNSVTWDMTDPIGVSEGKAVLKKNELLGAIASLTVTPLLQTNGSRTAPSVIFLPSSIWPENAGDAGEILKRDYYVGAAVWKEKDDGFGSGEYLVIREWTPQECGIMVKIVPTKSRGSMPASSMNTLHKVQKALAANYELLVEGYGRQHNWPDLDSWFYSKDTDWLNEGWCNLKTGKEKWMLYGLWPDNEQGFAYVYLFRPDGDRIIFW